VLKSDKKKQNSEPKTKSAAVVVRSRNTVAI
jgi:hypothetical protein